LPIKHYFLNMKKLLLLFVLWYSLPFFAQVGIGTTTPDASAMLDVQSTTSGILIPRMSATERDNIASPATGLMVYVTNDNSFYYFDGTTWLRIGNGAGDDGDWTVNGDDMYSAVSGNIGIGNNSPTFKLDLNGDMRHGNRLNIYSNRQSGYSTWVNFNSPDNGWGDNIFLGAGGTTVLGSGEATGTVQNNIDTTNGHETLYLSSDNNFHLYTNLQEGWNTRIEALLIDKDREWHIDFTRIYMHDSLNSNNRVRFITRTPYHWGYGLSINAGQGMAIGGGESSNKVFNNVDLGNNERLYLSSDAGGTAQAIKFITNLQNNWDDRIEAVTISGNGNVGIGTNTPSQKLDINGVMHLEPTTEPTDPSEGDIYMDSSTHKLRVFDGTVWHDLW
jgi:hypothetical protein